MTKLNPKNLDEMMWKYGRPAKFVMVIVFLLGCAIGIIVFPPPGREENPLQEKTSSSGQVIGCNDKPVQKQTSPGPVPTLSVVQEDEVPQSIGPEPVPLVMPMDEN